MSKGARGGFVEHLSRTKAVQQSMAKFVKIIVINLVTLKAAGKRQLLFSKTVLRGPFVEQSVTNVL
jgi:hypothetical protein